MKIFEKSESSYSAKVNFVDDNDVFVGYDMSQDCCEYADWFISENVSPFDCRETYTHDHPDLRDYIFDKNYFENVISADLDDGGQVVFRLVAEGKPDLYLNIFNCHNGYYGHGFEVKHSGQVVIEGVL